MTVLEEIDMTIADLAKGWIRNATHRLERLRRRVAEDDCKHAEQRSVEREEANMPAPEITINLADLLSGGDPDDKSLADRIVDAAAHQALRYLTAPGPEGEQSEVPTELGRRIETVVREEIQAQAAAAAPKVAEQILDEGIQPHDRYGSSRGDKIPLRTLVAQRVETELYDGQTGRKGGGVLKEMIEREVSRQVRGELQAALDEAKAKVVAAVGDEASNALTDVFEKLIPTMRVGRTAR